MTYVVEILHRITQGPVYFTVNIMAVDDLAMQGAWASATTILTWLNRNNSVPAR